MAEVFGDKWSREPLDALVNRGLITESRILKTPLAVAAGGWGQISGEWNSTRDPGYRKMLAFAEKVFRPSKHRDVAGTCGRDENCKCGNCWIRSERIRYAKKSGAPYSPRKGQTPASPRTGKETR